jgi:hypothetical protein
VLPIAGLDVNRLPGSSVKMTPSFEVSGCIGFQLRSRGRHARRAQRTWAA